MSVLLHFSKLLQKAEPHLLEIEPLNNGTCNYEDAVTSSEITAYELLNISNNRTKLNQPSFFTAYNDNLKLLLRNHQTLSYIDKNKPLVFGWKINNDTYTSTSLFFEYFMLNMMHATKQLSLALTKQIDDTNAALKDVKNTLLTNLAVLPEWKTTRYVMPNLPVVATASYLKHLIYFTHATQALYLSHEDKVNPIALQTAIEFYDKVWYRAPVYGQIAINHLLLAKSLLHLHHAQNVDMQEEADKKYTILKEATELYNLVSKKNCFLNSSLEAIDVNELAEEDMRTLETVHYATGDYDLRQLAQHRVIDLKVCKKTRRFGCKCNQ